MRGHSFFFKRINFKLVHSYNVKHLLVLYSVAADYKVYIQAPYMEVFNNYNIYIVYKISFTKYT